MTLMVTQLNNTVLQRYTQRGSVMTHQSNSNVARHREGEEEQPMTFRAHRLFLSGNSWYFNTREELDQGPFLSREMAEHAITKYIDELK